MSTKQQEIMNNLHNQTATTYGEQCDKEERIAKMQARIDEYNNQTMGK